MNAAPTTPTPTSNDAHARARGDAERFLTFTIAGELHAMPILAVREILRMMRVTPLPGAPAHVRGIVNLRGMVIPVVDMRARFGLPQVPDTKRTCIIVVQVEGGDGTRPTGLVVDQVDEVLSIPADGIEPPPGITNQRDLSGIAKARDRVILIVDVGSMVAGVQTA